MPIFRYGQAFPLKMNSGMSIDLFFWKKATYMHEKQIVSRYLSGLRSST